MLHGMYLLCTVINLGHFIIAKKQKLRYINIKKVFLFEYVDKIVAYYAAIMVVMAII